MKRWAHQGTGRIIAMACVASIALSACGGGGGSSSSRPSARTTASAAQPTATTPTPTASATESSPAGTTSFPAQRNTEVPLSEGTYVTTTFAEPALTMTLPGPWTFYDQGPTDIQIN